AGRARGVCPRATPPAWPASVGRWTWWRCERAATASRRAFVAQQPLLARQPVVVAAEAAVGAQHPMARDDRGDQVRRAGRAGGAGRPWDARPGGQAGVADR